jgi:hypothetical protein
MKPASMVVFPLHPPPPGSIAVVVAPAHSDSHQRRERFGQRRLCLGHRRLGALMLAVLAVWWRLRILLRVQEWAAQRRKAHSPNSPVSRRRRATVSCSGHSRYCSWLIPFSFSNTCSLFNKGSGRSSSALSLPSRFLSSRSSAAGALRISLPEIKPS